MRQRKKPSIPSPTDNDIKKKLTFSPSLNKIFVLCLVTRIINSLLVQTYFNPDEHWQALEVAHRITFGYFFCYFKLISFDLVSSCYIRAPRLLQSVFAAVGDLYLYKFSHVLFGDVVANWALFAQLTNWFMFFCIPRTLSNSLETVLTIVSLYYWPCMRNSSSSVTSGSRKCALAMAGLACAIRPTSAITWIYVGSLELLFSRDKLKFVLLEVVPIGGLVLGITFLLDRQIYGSWVFVPLNFLKFNFLSSGGDYYGTHPWHWYMTQGFTVMLFTHIPFSLAGIIKSRKSKLSGLIAWVLGIYSLLGHKEFRYFLEVIFFFSVIKSLVIESLIRSHYLQTPNIRFVLPVLPIALMFSGYSLANLRQHELSKKKKRLPKLQMAVLFLLVTNLPMALYMSLVHQRGTEDVMNYLSKEASEDRVKGILFLTPCHATPYYSTLHHNLPMRFLDCTPSEDKGVMDESDQFLMNPVGFATDFARNWSLPSYIVLFDSQEKILKEFLVLQHFHEIRRFFHAHFKVDRELQASVVVYALSGL
ncbi:hypothetical protein RD792_001155 [Penstemon davidsonii]|uniref:Mannosyltransferase n=1 Tax=Penstemon davidsonii TaxID=160366 RepID=A0ABR0DNU9_9LAMI|nr:hypothetical protein RD792_001155 [Penstemon davidsonii]